MFHVCAAFIAIFAFWFLLGGLGLLETALHH